MGVNGVPVAPHGLILGENEATPSRKLFKPLPGPPGPIFSKKITKNRTSENPKNPLNMGSAAWAEPLLYPVRGNPSLRQKDHFFLAHLNQFGTAMALK